MEAGQRQIVQRRHLHSLWQNGSHVWRNRHRFAPLLQEGFPLFLSRHRLQKKMFRFDIFFGFFCKEHWQAELIEDKSSADSNTNIRKEQRYRKKNITTISVFFPDLKIGKDFTEKLYVIVKRTLIKIQLFNCDNHNKLCFNYLILSGIEKRARAITEKILFTLIYARKITQKSDWLLKF